MTPAEARKRLSVILITLVEGLEAPASTVGKTAPKLHALAVEAKDLLPEAYGSLEALREVVEGMGGTTKVGTVHLVFDRQSAAQVGLLMSAAERWGFAVEVFTQEWDEPEVAREGGQIARYQVRATIEGEVPRG